MSMIEPVKPIVRTGLSEQVADQIAEMISGGRWRPGEKLPSEAELCKAFGVSRPSLREALKSLAFAGLVDMRSGQGTYVADGPWKFLDRLCAHGMLTTADSVGDLTTARLALEGELAALCAQRATDDELEHLKSLVSQIETCDTVEGFLRLDLEFHLAVAAYARSKILARFLRGIRGLLQEVIRKSADLPGDQSLTYEQHSLILSCLQERNPRKARSAMRKHIRTFQRSYSLLAKLTDGTTASP